MRTPSEAGRTLIEALITMALLSAILLVVALTVQRYSNVTRFAKKKSQRFVATAALNVVAREVSQAVRLRTPAPNSTRSESELEFSRLKPGAEDTIPDTLPSLSARPSSWNLHRSSNLMLVRYYLDDKQLVRRTTVPNADPSTQFLASSLADFRVQTMTSGGLLLELDVEEEATTHTVRVKTLVWSLNP